MSPNEYTYHELQKINEHLRRENHLLRLLDDLQHGAKGIYAPVNACVHTSQETPTEDAGDRSAGDESQGTLVGDVVQKMDVDAHGDKAEDQHKHPDEKEAKDGEKDDADEGKEDEVEENEKKKEEKEEEDEEDYEEEEYDDDDDDDVSTWISNCTDEDSKLEDEEDEKEVPEEFYIRELHHCNPRAHRNAVLSLFKRDVLELVCTTPIDNMHIDLHQNLEGCSSLQPLALGNCKFDASLYVASDANPYKRTDVWVYRLLYGLHPAVVLWIGKSLPLSWYSIGPTNIE